MGIGLVFYFKNVKAFAILFFIILLYNIPLYYVYTSNHLEKPILSYKDALFKTTIGNIGSSNNKY